MSKRLNDFRVVIGFIVVGRTEIAHIVDYISQIFVLCFVDVAFRVDEERRDRIRNSRMDFENS